MIKVMKGEIFSCQKQQIRIPPPEKKPWSKLDLIAYISTRIKPMNLGFTVDKAADRNWLLSVAYSFDCNLECFTGTSNEDIQIGIPVKYLENGNFFDPYTKKSIRPIFLKDDKQRDVIEKKKVEKRIIKKNRRRELLMDEVRKLERNINDLVGNDMEHNSDDDVDI